MAAWRALLCLLAPLLIVYLLELRVRRAWLLQRQEREQLPSLCSTAGQGAARTPWQQLRRSVSFAAQPLLAPHSSCCFPAPPAHRLLPIASLINAPACPSLQA